jgi:peptidoglycan/LPS O-acetylase OafA/YrhL
MEAGKKRTSYHKFLFDEKGACVNHQDGKRVAFLEPPRKMGPLEEFFACFAVGKNMSFLSNDKHSSGPFGMLNGLRVVMMFWVMLGHTAYYQLSTNGYENLSHIHFVSERFSFQILTSAYYAVDVFFLMSGFLVAYLTYEEVKANKLESAKAWSYYIFHRFWRLTPAYMFVLFFMVKLVPFIGEGPFWYLYSNPAVSPVGYCDKYWWTNFLYINNLVPSNIWNGCMSWSWYLANDMQFYCVVPFIMILYRSSRKAFWIVMTFFIMISMFITGFLTVHYWPQGLQVILQDKVYAKPYVRIPPYLMGMCIAFLVVDHKDSLKRLFKISAFKWLMYLLAFGLTFSITFVSYKNQGWGAWQWAFYEAASRQGFCTGVGLLILATFAGRGGVVRWFLSAPFWGPLAKLTYCAYLIHPVAMGTLYLQQTRQAHYSWSELGYAFLGNICYSYSLALVLHLLIEKPCSNLERLMRRSKK